jgi:hypothetical protein
MPRPTDYLAELLAGREPPCLSLYQPTHRHHPDNQQDATRFRNLLKSIERSPLQERSVRDAAPLAEPFRELADDARLWNHMLDGLAVFGAAGFFRVRKLQRPLPELAVVAKSFHIKPLVRILPSTDRYQVLGLTLHDVKLFEGDRDALDEVELAPGAPRTITEALGDQLTDPHQTFVAYRTGAGPGKATHHGQGSRRDEADADSDPGRLDKANGRIELHPLSHPHVGDLLDDLAELVLERGGQLFVVPNDRMPTDTGVAAIYRF